MDWSRISQGSTGQPALGESICFISLSFALSTLALSFEVNSVQKWEEVILMAAICEKKKLAEYFAQRQLTLRLESLVKRTNDSFAPQRY